MPIIERSGNIFTSDAQVLVNTVNCVGVMGAGIALEMRYRFPAMFERYVERCEANRVKIGSLHLDTSTTPWVLNFPTKKHWRYPSRPEYLKSGLAAFCKSWQSWQINSIAFPILGASHGGLAPEASREIMYEALDGLPLSVEIWSYNPDSTDDLVPPLRAHFLALTDREIAKQIGLAAHTVAKVRTALDSITQTSQLAQIRGFGEATMEKVYQYAIGIRRIDRSNVQGVLGLDF